MSPRPYPTNTSSIRGLKTIQRIQNALSFWTWTELIHEDYCVTFFSSYPVQFFAIDETSEIWKFSHFRFMFLSSSSMTIKLSPINVKDFETFISTVTVMPRKRVLIVWVVLVEVVVKSSWFSVRFSVQNATREFVAIRVKPILIPGREANVREYFMSNHRFVWIGSGFFSWFFLPFLNSGRLVIEIFVTSFSEEGLRYGCRKVRGGHQSWHGWPFLTMATTNCRTTNEAVFWVLLSCCKWRIAHVKHVFFPVCKLLKFEYSYIRRRDQANLVDKAAWSFKFPWEFNQK